MCTGAQTWCGFVGDAVGGNLVQNGKFLLPALAPSWMASLNGTQAGAYAVGWTGERNTALKHKLCSMDVHAALFLC
jgi:hypothetical protein